MPRVLLVTGAAGVDTGLRRRAWIRSTLIERSRALFVEDVIVLDETLRCFLFAIYRAMGPRLVHLWSDGTMRTHCAGGTTTGTWAYQGGRTELDAMVDLGDASRGEVTALVIDDGGDHPDLRRFMQTCADRGWRVERFVLGDADAVDVSGG